MSSFYPVIDVYAHVDGIDLQKCNHPIKISWDKMFTPLEIVVERNNYDLTRNVDYNLDWNSWETTLYITMLKVHERACIKFTTVHGVYRSYCFNSIVDLQIMTDFQMNEYFQIHTKSLHQLLNETSKIQDLLKMQFLMYNKMCSMMIDNGLKLHEVEKRSSNDYNLDEELRNKRMKSSS